MQIDHHYTLSLTLQNEEYHDGVCVCDHDEHTEKYAKPRV